MALLASVVCASVSTLSATADDTPGIVRLRARQPSPIQQTSYLNATALFDLGHDHKSSACGTGCADPCCPPEDCAEGCRGEGRTPSEGCGCGCSGNGENSGLFDEMFGGRQAKCSCDQCDHCGNGKSATLFDCLFGCMRPAGACEQGAPLFGKYRVTYAHKPDYADPRDGQPWAAQGYRIPVTVPTAPIVRYSYNYSHGTPASRLTPLSTYNPSTGPQSLHLQSWH